MEKRLQFRALSQPHGQTELRRHHDGTGRNRLKGLTKRRALKFGFAVMLHRVVGVIPFQIAGRTARAAPSLIGSERCQPGVIRKTDGILIEILIASRSAI